MPTSHPGSGAGAVRSVNLSDRKGVRKRPGERGMLICDRGLQGDAHAGDWHRQVSLLALESIETMRAQGLAVGPGDFAENLTTEGIALSTLPIGTKIRLGEALVAVSQIGKECHTKCAIYQRAGDCVMPREGIFAVVLEGGAVQAGDPIQVVQMGDGTCHRLPPGAPAPSGR